MQQSSPDTKKRRILIVEDNMVNLRLFNDVLVKQGYEVCGLEDGSAAKDIALSFQPELILLDIQLHNMSGIDVLKVLKSDDRLRDIKVIALTAFAMPEDEERFLSAGFDHYITKPISITSFVSDVSRMLSTVKQDQG